ncbi:unnamed protein product [marine sediment metagenome]|uniref:Uncharacterized protein n=1 Tax=marine sediment metagenome TaxID=412755 RepID=X0SBL8_9ZZZZ
MNWSDITAIVAIIISIIAIVWNLISYLSKRIPALDLSIDIYISENKDSYSSNSKRLVMIKCKLGNRGNYRLDIKRAKLIIDEGTFSKDKNELKFSKIWQWKEKCPDCELSKWYQDEKNSNLYPGYIDLKEVEGKFTYCTDLSYFASAIEYVLPGEFFIDTKILLLDKKKYYCVVFLVIPKPIKYFLFFDKKLDCLCMFDNIPPGNYRKIG